MSDLIFHAGAHRPAELTHETPQQIFDRIQAARALIAHHNAIANNGEESAAAYYRFIPEVAADFAAARYTLDVCFGELKARDTFKPYNPNANSEAAIREAAHYTF